MMISPDSFREEYKSKSYKELLLVRDAIIDEIHAFEHHSYNPELAMTHPSPEVVYLCNLDYLGKLCELITEKYREKNDDHQR